MSPALLSIFFNSTLALLLVITIAYCSKLNKKIRQLQDGRSELAEMIGRFDKSTERATLSLSELQTVSKKITDGLQLKIDKANFLADDLAFLIEKSSKLASQLEQLQKSRPEPAPARTMAVMPSKPAFEAMSQHQDKTTAAAKPGIEQLLAATPAQGPSVASIEAMLQKLSASTAPAKRPAISESEPTARTGAERELLNALKSGR